MPDHGNGMLNPNDVTIDIPLTETTSRGQTGARKWNTNTSPDDGTSHATEKEPIVGHHHHHHHRGPGGRRRTDTDINELSGKPAVAPEDGTINRMGRFYQAVLNYSLITRYLIYVIPIAILIAIPIIVGATVAQDAKIGGVHIYWFFTWIEIIWFSLWTSKIFARYIPYFFQFLCGIVSSGTRKYALILRALETPIALLIWAIISLVTFLPVMNMTPGKRASGDTSPNSWEKSVKNILFALLVCSLIYLVEKALVQLISISYHRKQFDAKIQISKRNVHLVTLLFDASRNMFPVYCPEFKEEDSLIFDSILAQAGTKGGKRSSAMPLRMLRHVGKNVGRVGDKVTAAFGHVASELTGKQVFNPTATHTMVIEALERKRHAAALARRIWMSFVVEGRDALFMDDIVEVLGAEHEAEAEECFMALDKDGNGDISLDEMVLTITEFGRMRKALNHSMHDVDQAIRVLDNLLMCVAGLVGVLVFISFVTTGFGTVIAAGATSLLSLSFVFSVTAQEVLGSCIFLFVKHPFDIGDRVEVGDKPFIVERISLLFTVFRNVTDARITQVPNNILNSLWVDNFTRAKAMHEQLIIPVAFDTTFAEVQLLRQEMENFVRDKDNCRDFQRDVDIELDGVGDMDKLQLRVDIRHKSNWSNETIRAARRSKFLCALVLAVRKIQVRGPGVEVPAEETADAADGDDKGDDAGAGAGAGRRKSTQGGGVDSTKPDPAVAAAAAGILNYENTAQSTGYDQARSGTVTHRGSTHTNAEREAAIVEMLNARPPTVDISRDHNGSHEDALQRTTTNTSNQGNQLNVHTGGEGLNRGLSTGHRKAGDRVSYSEQDIHPAHRNAPLSPVPAGMTPSSSQVPILETPKPGSRGSARYEPRPHSGQDQNQSTVQMVGSPDPNPFNGYYAHDTGYNHIPVGGYSAENTPGRDRRDSNPNISGVTANSNYQLSDPYDPVSPPSIYSPPQSTVPQQAANTYNTAPLRKKDKSPYGEHEA
ncbi:Mechanosensitive ion channel MscS [Penicillium concentricum]|uniref:Mechanosensitive ion channel MscS n=1 Tax=Penicillium concentricum TaxID=293559 RepID=A0A9W9S9U7_9EURO|nr:Mechanosensitive ion channel MscS [Penicillium concentricum]KAJ5373264.1 Mechanosensitive ion channel MscS [Penicillium concentricum]